MVLVSSSFYSKWKRYWQRKRYQRLDGAITTRKKMKIIRFEGIPRRFWKIKAMPKLRILKNVASPMKLLSKAKKAYVDPMPRAGSVNTARALGNKWVLRGRQGKSVYPSEEFEKRLIYEISKNFLANRELYTM